SLKPRIVALLEEKTGRKVSFSGVSLSLLPGIGVRISGLTVSGDPGHPEENLLSVPDAEVRVAFRPLLSGRVEFSKLILRRPEVLFRKYRDGTHSGTRISDRMAKGEGAAPRPGEKVSIALSALTIEKAKLILALEGEDKRETRWTIDPFTCRLSGIGAPQSDFEIETRIDGAVRGEIEFAGRLTREGGPSAGAPAYRLHGKGKTFGQPVTVEGTFVSPEGPLEMDLAVAFPQIDLEKIPRVFAPPPAMLSDVTLKGMAALTVKASGTSQAMGLEAQLRYPSLLLTANATLSPSTGRREWSASARVESLADLARSLGGALAGWEPAGKLTASAHGKRPDDAAKETWNLSLSPDGAGFRLPAQRMEVRGLSGRVDLSGSRVDFQPLAGSVNGQAFTLSGPVFLGTAPTGLVRLRMAYLDLDALFPPSKGSEPAKRKEPSPPAAGGEKGKGVAAHGSLQVDAGKGRGLEFRDLSGSGRYEDGTLVLDSLRLRLYGGEATASGRIRLAGKSPDFRLKLSARDVAAEEILSRKTSLKDFLSGKASLTTDIAGAAGNFDEFARTAEGSGSFRVAGGRIKGVDLLSTAAGLSGLRSVVPAGPGGRAGETTFSDLSADFRIAGGKIRTDKLRIRSEKMDLSGSAALGFDKTLDYRGALVLSKELSDRARGTAGQFLTGSSGRVEIPLMASGPVTSPSVKVDGEALSRGLGEKALRRLMEKAPGKQEPGKALEG
ncbi:MAG TPA: AsmA-like C-terminal region-containing protein, partial [Candidatus Deferrimicrobiaceae bacterium]|nr:AsmA-like C-terminal region-containing protein [Candidatus Deferrimicrobiaceae bacterium]